MKSYAKILFPQRVGNLDDTLTYSVPSSLELKEGDCVSVPFKKSQKEGIVWEITNTEPQFRTRAISEKIYRKPLLNTQQLSLIKWMHEYYFCPLSKLLSIFIPKRVLKNQPYKERKAKEDEQENKTSPKDLTTEQAEVIKAFTASKEQAFLLHGITGSGKTEIYTHLAKQYIEKQQQVLILVPEISLTPQTIQYFENALGVNATIINSKQSLGEKYRAWMQIWRSQTQLVIGSRSAIFSPFQNLGLIVIDEEHENSYKQDNSPRYSVHKIIEQLQTLPGAPRAVFGSATPSIETAERLKNTKLELKERIGNSELPEIEIVDLKEEFQKGNHSIFSDTLQQALQDTLNKKEQAILFLNRRGSASSVVCRDCGYTSECQNCETKLTHHEKTIGKPSLICHHCGAISTPPSICPNCQGPNIRYLGIGTQKIEAELQKTFPEARILRADKDTTASKTGFANIYKAFKKHEADFLVGTQMIAKGLHLPKVNLVGVVLADIGLNIPDFRTAERNFQLMTQVAGRAGRTETKGRVIIQTYNPDNLALTLTQKNDYAQFFNYERTQRALLKYPPFGELAKLLIEDKSLENCRQTAEKLENKLWQIAREQNLTENLEILSYPAYLMRLKGIYRYVVLIKSPTEPHALLKALPAELRELAKIDINPTSTT